MWYDLKIFYFKMRSLLIMSYKTTYYSGFCLHDEQGLFDEYLIDNDFTLSGFSYGAIKAFEEALHSSKRVDVLQLFSPAFFQDKDEKFKRMQLMFFKKNAQGYCENFLKNVVYPSSKNIEPFFKQGSFEELDELLHYVWDTKKIQALCNKGTKIEVYVGSEDKIVDANSIKEFFTPFATVYYIKECGHIL